VTYEAVAQALNLPYLSPEQALSPLKQSA